MNLFTPLTRLCSPTPSQTIIHHFLLSQQINSIWYHKGIAWGHQLHYRVQLVFITGLIINHFIFWIIYCFDVYWANSKMQWREVRCERLGRSRRTSLLPEPEPKVDSQHECLLRLLLAVHNSNALPHSVQFNIKFSVYLCAVCMHVIKIIEKMANTLQQLVYFVKVFLFKQFIMVCQIS